MEQYQSISIMKAKKDNKDFWLVILSGNIENKENKMNFIQKEFDNFNEVKEFLNTLTL